MLVKIPDFDDSLAATLQDLTGQKTAAGAVRHVCENHQYFVQRAARQERDIVTLNIEVVRLCKIIENARVSASALLDKTSQEDIFQ